MKKYCLFHITFIGKKCSVFVNGNLRLTFFEQKCHLNHSKMFTMFQK